MQIVNQTVPRALRSARLPGGAGRGDRRVHRRARPRHRRARPAARALRGVRLRDGRAGDHADGPRADDGGGRSRSCPARSPRRSTCRRRRPSRRSRTSTSRAGSSASRRSRSTATTARSASRCRPARARARPSDGRGRAVEKVVEYRPTRKRLPKSRPSQTTSFTVGGAEGYMTAGSYPDDGLGEVFLKLGKQGSTLAGVMDAFSIAISIALQYGVPLETYVAEVHQHALRAGRPDRRPGHPDGAVDHGLHLPPPGAGLPALRDPRRRSASTPPRSAPASSRPARTRRPRTTVEEDLESLAQSAPVREGRRRGRRGRRGRGRRPRPACTARPSCSSRSPGSSADAPLCMTCGTKMRPAGSCYVCEGCGSTSGCS